MSLIKKYIDEYEKSTLYRLCLKKQEGNIPFHLRNEYIQELENVLDKDMKSGNLSIPFPLLKELFSSDNEFWQQLAEVMNTPDNYLYVSYLFNFPDGLKKLGLLGDVDIPDFFTFSLLNKIRDSLLDDFSYKLIVLDPQKANQYAMGLINQSVSLCIPYLQTEEENMLWNAFDNEISLWVENKKVFKFFENTSKSWQNFMKKKNIDGLTESFAIIDYIRGDQYEKDVLRKSWMKNQELADSIRDRAEKWREFEIMGLLDELKTKKALSLQFQHSFK